MQNRPGSDLDGLVRFFPNASSPEASRCARTIGPSFWQNATGPLPVSHFQTRLCSATNSLDRIVQNQAGSDLVLADRVRFLAEQIRSGSQPVCNNHPARFWPLLPSQSGPDANQIQQVYWVTVHCCLASLLLPLTCKEQTSMAALWGAQLWKKKGTLLHKDFTEPAYQAWKGLHIFCFTGQLPWSLGWKRKGTTP